MAALVLVALLGPDATGLHASAARRLTTYTEQHSFFHSFISMSALIYQVLYNVRS